MIKNINKKIKQYMNETDENGFSLLELVVAVGILLVLTVGGLIAYNGITKNARQAAVSSAASEVYTAAVAYEADDDPDTDAAKAASEWKSSNKGNVEVETSGSGSDLSVTAFYKDKADTTSTTATIKSERSAGE